MLPIPTPNNVPTKISVGNEPPNKSYYTLKLAQKELETNQNAYIYSQVKHLNNSPKERYWKRVPNKTHTSRHILFYALDELDSHRGKGLNRSKPYLKTEDNWSDTATPSVKINRYKANFEVIIFIQKIQKPNIQRQPRQFS